MNGAQQAGGGGDGFGGALRNLQQQLAAAEKKKEELAGQRNQIRERAVEPNKRIKALDEEIKGLTVKSTWRVLAITAVALSVIAVIGASISLFGAFGVSNQLTRVHAGDLALIALLGVLVFGGAAYWKDGDEQDKETKKQEKERALTGQEYLTDKQTVADAERGLKLINGQIEPIQQNINRIEGAITSLSGNAQGS
ncbi:hypothetical protein SCG7109_BP_00010 [Chlamydiales bacterium SCGC AG-110-M15]|nr:hypothetical protein SCG7109_BP_00010 [Chlamydiales bacterium SCGC AG-110-M15]